MSPDLPTVLHVLPFDQARGAQRYARALVDQLGAEHERHLLLTMFQSDRGVLKADISLDVPRGFWRNLGLDPRALIGLRRVLREVGPEMVVAHGGEPAKYVALALDESTPFVYVNIGSAHPRLNRWLSRWLRDRYTKRARVIVTVSHYLAREVAADGIPGEKIVVIPNGRDAARFRPPQKGEGGTEETIDLIWIGQLDTSKRPDLFIDAVGLLREEGANVHGVLVGDGPRRVELTSRAEEGGVSMLGSRDDVPELLASSDVFVFTGAPPEGMPGVLIEAGLSGLATVSTRVPGADEVIEDGRSGMLVDVDDRTGLIEAVRYLVDDSSVRHQMGLKARARCVEHFSMEVTVKLWRELLTGLLSR